MLSDLFLYLHAPATGALTGYTVAQVRNKDGLVVDGAYRAVRRWALALPKEEAGQKVQHARRSGRFPCGGGGARMQMMLTTALRLTAG